jgi:glycosyltransferase involved in cell wall biosynthesis
MTSTSREKIIRVGFDDQIFVAQARGGISKYFVELIERLPSHGIEPILLSRGTRNRHLIESGLVSELPPDGRIRGLIRAVAWRLTGWLSTSVSANDKNLDIIHHTFTMGPYLRRWRGKRVVTNFDMIPEIFPSYFKLGNPHFAKRRYCECCNAVISISQSTTNDMLRLYGNHLASKTVQIPFGVSETFLSAASVSNELGIELPTKYLLFVGVRRGYKRFDLALNAFMRLAKTDPELHLVIVGGGLFSREEMDSIKKTNFIHRISRVAPTDDEIREVYRRAEVFLFPSEYEGFGLPTLEALATGTPTVLADASCSREVGGDVALYFAPGDLDDLVRCTERAMSDSIRMRTLKDGPRHASNYTWDRVAEMTATLYKDVVKGALTNEK